MLVSTFKKKILLLKENKAKFKKYQQLLIEHLFFLQHYPEIIIDSLVKLII